MDRSPIDPTAGSAAGALAGAPLPARESSPPGADHHGGAPTETPPAPPADWREQLARQQQRAEAAERRAAEHAQQVQQFNGLIAAAQTQHEQQEYLALDNRFASGEITQEQYRQGMAHFIGRERQRAEAAQQRAQQTERRMTVGEYKGYLVKELSLTDEEAGELTEFDPLAFSDPDAYLRQANRIVANRAKFQTLEQRMAALERDREADEYVASGASRVSSGHGGGQAPRPVGPIDDMGSAIDSYLSIPRAPSLRRSG